MNSLKIEQLFDHHSSTFTYLLWDTHTRDALILDPVFECFERDKKLIQTLQLKLLFSLETHVHAEHVTSGLQLKETFGCKLGASKHLSTSFLDLALNDGMEIKVGGYNVQVLETPGHTRSCLSFYVEGYVFTGDTLLIQSTGRTDFQGGSTEALFESIQKLYRLPDSTIVYPGHDYHGHSSSTILLEKTWNHRVNATTKKDELLHAMASIKLPPPANIKEAVSFNLEFGKGFTAFKINENSTHEAVCSGEPTPSCSGDTHIDLPKSVTQCVPQEFQKLLSTDKNKILLDVRSPFEHQTERLLNSKNIPVEELAQRLSEISKEKTLYIYCRSGNRSKIAASILVKNGFGKLIELQGGIANWGRNNLPTEKSTQSVMPIEQQTFLAVGLILITGGILTLTLHSKFIFISLFIGCGLTYAALSGNCMLTKILLRLPWNKGKIQCN